MNTATTPEIITIEKVIAGRTVVVKAELYTIEETHITLICGNEWDALVVCHYYNGRKCKIEETTDGRYLVVVKNIEK
jgi:hypothetical protein